MIHGSKWNVLHESLPKEQNGLGKLHATQKAGQGLLNSSNPSRFPFQIARSQSWYVYDPHPQNWRTRKSMNYKVMKRKKPCILSLKKEKNLMCGVPKCYLNTNVSLDMWCAYVTPHTHTENHFVFRVNVFSSNYAIWRMLPPSYCVLGYSCSPFSFSYRVPKRSTYQITLGWTLNTWLFYKLQKLTFKVIIIAVERKNLQTFLRNIMNQSAWNQHLKQ